MTNAEIAELRRNIGHLRQCLGTLRKRYGDSPAVRRLVNDIDRLNIDTDELEDHRLVPKQTAMKSERVVIPDTPYDESLWAGADDEGVGGYHRGENT